MMELEDVNNIDWARLDRMKTWAYRLDSRYGELPFWPLVVKLHGWVKNRMEDCAEDDSEANELMLKRVPYHALNYAAPFIDMRHWDSLHQENNHWIGEYEVDETDWKLCELIARIQYATQQQKRHQQRSLDGYYKLPDIFTREDVMKCFGYENENSVNTKLRRLLEGHLIEKISEGKDKGCYKKVNKMVI